MSSTNSTSKSNVFEPASYETLKEKADIANECVTKRKALNEVRKKKQGAHTKQIEAMKQIRKKEESINKGRTALTELIERNSRLIEKHTQNFHLGIAEEEEAALKETELMQWFEQHPSLMQWFEQHPSD
jgi:hypothetical protein